MTQTLAIFLDAYRELNSRKLFWISLILSALVVAVFAIVGINEKAVTIFGFETPFPFGTAYLSRGDFYKLMFSVLGVGLWLSWISTILALVSTAGIFPDLITGGSIDLFLSKPISRLRLFFTKYAAALLFVALQALVFSLASFLVIGLRAGEWEPGLFLAVPLVLIFFTYLYCVCVFLGLITRSTVAALLLTLVFWFIVYAIQATEVSLLFFKIAKEQEVTQVDRKIAGDKQDIERIEKISTSTQPSLPLQMTRTRLEIDQKRKAEVASSAATLTKAHRIFYGVETALPKTSGTVELLQRWLVEKADLPEAPKTDDNAGAPAGIHNNPELQRQIQKEMLSRSPSWILGTSLGFEAIVLTLSAWIFCRRDF
jgi:ABC-type transport system involved in multi-copper enzyme maturation permease subunit